MVTTLYATLADVRNNINASSTTGDAQALGALRVVSARIDRIMSSRKTFFAPVLEERQFAITTDRVNSFYISFLLNMPLLSITTAYVGTTDVTSYVEVFPPYPSPYSQVQLTDPTRYWYWLDYCTYRRPTFFKLTGYWGYNSDYANAWLAVDTLAVQINASITTITVADIDGTNEYGLAPRISAGNLLKIDDELLEVTATNTTTNVATVRRGVNGTTAASHLISATVSTYQVDEPIRHITARQAALLYGRRGAYDNQNISDIASVQYPSDLLAELTGTLTQYAYA